MFLAHTTRFKCENCTFLHSVFICCVLILIIHNYYCCILFSPVSLSHENTLISALDSNCVFIGHLRIVGTRPFLPRFVCLCVVLPSIRPHVSIRIPLGEFFEIWYWKLLFVGQPLTVEAHVRFGVSLCGICCAKGSTAAHFSQSRLLWFPLFGHRGTLNSKVSISTCHGGSGLIPDKSV